MKPEKEIKARLETIEDCISFARVLRGVDVMALEAIAMVLKWVLDLEEEDEDTQEY